MCLADCQCGSYCCPTLEGFSLRDKIPRIYTGAKDFPFTDNSGGLTRFFSQHQIFKCKPWQRDRCRLLSFFVAQAVESERHRSPSRQFNFQNIHINNAAVRANKGRGGGFWPDDDYDVRDEGNRVIGRIMLHPQAPKDEPWFFWTITAREAKPSVYNKGYAVSREQAMTDFKARWCQV